MRGLLFRSIADMRRSDSWITRLRQQRIALFMTLLAKMSSNNPERPLQLLDVGGTAFFWHILGMDSTPQTASVSTPQTASVSTPQTASVSKTEAVYQRPIHITLLNISQPGAVPPNFTNLIGDGCAMPQFQNQQFDIVFSNSVIEHVGDWARQQAFAQEVRRVGRCYFVQTPNHYFPIEPHFFFPGFQFLPVRARVWLVQHFALGWFPRLPDEAAARREVEQIQLLSTAKVRNLFPQAQIHAERFMGMTVGIVAYAGWGAGQ